jgi:hypothetical protein
MGVGAGDDDFARLEGLTQAVEGLGAELRYYVATGTNRRAPAIPISPYISGHGNP